MKYFKIVLSLLGTIILISFYPDNRDTLAQNEPIENPAPEKVEVLNFGTFHMGFTNDANTTEFDENDRKNQERVHEVAERLAEFNPTVIIVEQVPEKNEAIQNEYRQYRENPDMTFENPSEVELLAYELGRLSGTERIYGIDHKMSYNYRIGQQVDNQIDPEWHDKYYEDPFSFYPSIDVNKDTLSLQKKLELMNTDEYLNFLIAVNADMLTHAGTENGFEGADEAAKYYQRNLRMYSNLNRLDLNKDDRVFILMGASHTAFFRNFMRGDPKYKMVDTFEYLSE
ncbi:DUF5694 domain-containing protein [Rhodohalobacter sp.]|uniref:DUF5694 domain-containing protein n=1 Tax=Rhodohalobacter sp. TaxID=1974210 RepID=UPI002ACD415C|nr:DUF5694 domain-containing protein [Rhodohalobacter sp.]MDZ7757718.1 DUF5694 domain-containing protein [Rhodohalobacter sp.]